MAGIWSEIKHHNLNAGKCGLFDGLIWLFKDKVILFHEGILNHHAKNAEELTAITLMHGSLSSFGVSDTLVCWASSFPVEHSNRDVNLLCVSFLFSDGCWHQEVCFPTVLCLRQHTSWRCKFNLTRVNSSNACRWFLQCLLQNQPKMLQVSSAYIIKPLP